MVIYHYLFDGRMKVEKKMKEGFLLNIIHIKVDIQKKKQAMWDENLWYIFTGKNSMTLEGFLRVCEFSYFLLVEVEMLFRTCVLRMTSSKRCMLATFITSLEFLVEKLLERNWLIKIPKNLFQRKVY